MLLVLSDFQICHRVTSYCVATKSVAICSSNCGGGVERARRSPGLGAQSWLCLLWPGHLFRLCLLRLLTAQGRAVLDSRGGDSVSVACDRTPTPAADGKGAKQVHERKGQKWWSSFRLSWIQGFTGTSSSHPPPPHLSFSCKSARDAPRGRSHTPQGLKTSSACPLPSCPSLFGTELSKGSGGLTPDKCRVPRSDHCARGRGH